jgi:signal transduction histidine kinase
VEHRDRGHYSQRDVRIMEGLADVLALTVDNARSFQRLRTLGAEEERSRIARDLHDRLGQWLSYISFELERIISTTPDGSDELDRLYADVQTAIDELRETLRQLRSGVTADRSLEVVARELVERFNARGETLGTLTVTHPGARLPVRVENELLRVLQESLSNVAKHARADRVEVTWDVVDGSGTLMIADDGRGFDAARGVRDSAYGLVGMRERADVVGARISIESVPGQGTTVTIRAGHDQERSPISAPLNIGMTAAAGGTKSGTTNGVTTS